MSRIKLTDFVSESQRNTFIDHLDGLQTIKPFTFVIAGDAILLDVHVVDTQTVFYTNVIANLKNEPIIAIGVHCSATNDLSDWDHTELDLKSFTN